MFIVKTKTSYKWKPLVDLPANPLELTSRELESLQLVWDEQQASLAESGALEEHYQRLRREWSIETGIIEGVYTLDRGTTQILIERGIDASLIPHEATNRDPTLVARIVQDHNETLEGMFALVKGERGLTAGYIKELHAALLRHQDTVKVVDQFGNLFEKKLEKGCYKKTPNNPTRPDGSTHEYCPPEHVASEMDRMIALHEEHVQAGVPAEVEAAWLHHVFTQIHPFEDGNGRVARAIATLVFLKAKMFPLVVRRDDRTRYIEALEAADQTSLKPLVGLFTDIQKRDLVRAIDLTVEQRPARTIDEAIGAARAALAAKDHLTPERWEQAKSAADRLLDLGYQTLTAVAEKLRVEIGGVKPGVEFVAEVTPGAEGGSKEYHRWIVLKLHTDREVRLRVWFHPTGLEFLGLLTASVILDGQEPFPPMQVTDDFFQINYKEDPTQAEKRFQPWLEAAIVKGLSLWRQQL
jgi:Fic family protein